MNLESMLLSRLSPSIRYRSAGITIGPNVEALAVPDSH